MIKGRIVGYTSGVFDLFHIGHLNMLRNAKSMCDTLIVGVTSDELVSYKNKRAVVPYEERIQIVRELSFVDLAVPQYDLDKVAACKKLKFDILFVGDDWYESDKWETYEKELKKLGAIVVYFPYTRGTTSTLINETLARLRGEPVKKIPPLKTIVELDKQRKIKKR